MGIQELYFYVVQQLVYSWQRSLELVKSQLFVLENILTLHQHSCSHHHGYIHWDGKVGIHHKGNKNRPWQRRLDSIKWQLFKC